MEVSSKKVYMLTDGSLEMLGHEHSLNNIQFLLGQTYPLLNLHTLKHIVTRIADFNMTSNEEYDYGQSSQDKGKGKETEIVNRFPNPPEPNQNYPRPQMPYRWPTPVITNDNTDNPGKSNHT